MEVPTTRPIPFLDARRVGASVILALFIANSDEAVDLALDMVREKPLLPRLAPPPAPDRTLPAWDDKAKKKVASRASTRARTRCTWWRSTDAPPRHAR